MFEKNRYAFEKNGVMPEEIEIKERLWKYIQRCMLQSESMNEKKREGGGREGVREKEKG